MLGISQGRCERDPICFHVLSHRNEQNRLQLQVLTRCQMQAKPSLHAQLAARSRRYDYIDIVQWTTGDAQRRASLRRNVHLFVLGDDYPCLCHGPSHACPRRIPPVQWCRGLVYWRPRPKNAWSQLVCVGSPPKSQACVEKQVCFGSCMFHKHIVC